MAINYDPGNYLCEMVDFAFTESSNKKPMIQLRVRPLELVRFAGTEGEMRSQVSPNEKVGYMNLVIDPDSEQSRGITMRKLRTAGWAGTSFSTFALDSPFLCSCDHEEYKGKPKEKWDILLVRKTAEHKPELAVRMDEIMDKMLQSDSLASAVPAVPQSPSTGGGPPDDDIPFMRLEDRV